MTNIQHNLRDSGLLTLRKIGLTEECRTIRPSYSDPVSSKLVNRTGLFQVGCASPENTVPYSATKFFETSQNRNVWASRKRSRFYELKVLIILRRFILAKVALSSRKGSIWLQEKLSIYEHTSILEPQQLGVLKVAPCGPAGERKR